MKRREFLTASLAAGAVLNIPAAAQSESQCYFEFIRYQAVNNSLLGQLEKYWEHAAIPAFNRIGIEPVGVFRSKYGSHGCDMYVLLPHKNLESFESSWEKISQDETYKKNGAEFLDPDIKNPLYYRYETSLLKAYSQMPTLKVPDHIANKKGRIFEVRIYESHSRHKAKLKVEMFNQGGEIALFRETGLHPVMFAETLAGNKMPNLIYILGFESMTERDQNWNTFGSSEGWQKMKSNPRYSDTVSSVTDIILSPASCSQI